MNRRKFNNSSRYSLVLAALLLIFCLVVSTGTSRARYRTEVSDNLRFEARKSVSVYLGQVEYGEETDEGRFVQTDEGGWERSEDGSLQLNFAVANGTSHADFEEEDQKVYIRLVGSLGIQSEDEEITLTLTFPSADQPEELEQVEAKAIRIVSGSPLHTTFGEGWVFRFMEGGEELTWALEGGQLSYIEMGLTLEGATMDDASLLQLQLAGSYLN